MRIADLPWYDFVELREQTDAWWAGVAGHLRELGIRQAPDRLDRNGHHAKRWRLPELLLSQACGYDVLYDSAEFLVPVATPCYAAEGCEGPRYRSFVVVRADQPWQRFEDLRGLRLAINQRTSHSGTNALRPEAAAHHQGGSFFGAVLESGSHLDSLRSLHEGGVEVACIDAVVLALLKRVRPEAVAGIRAVACTRAALAPPYVTSVHTPLAVRTKLAMALLAAARDPALARVREALLIRDVAVVPAESYAELADFEAAALANGYRELPAPASSPLGRA